MRQAERRQSDAARKGKGKGSQHRTLAIKQQPMKPCFTLASALGVAGGAARHLPPKRALRALHRCGYRPGTQSGMDTVSQPASPSRRFCALNS